MEVDMTRYWGDKGKAREKYGTKTIICNNETRHWIKPQVTSILFMSSEHTSWIYTSLKGRLQHFTQFVFTDNLCNDNQQLRLQNVS
jgi:hypothetical protein